MISAVIFFLGGLALLLKGSDMFVDSSVRIAKYAGISEVVIGLTLVAVGTSLPELATSVTAAYYGNTGLAVGNVVESNIANLSLVVGVSSFVSPIIIPETSISVTIPLMIILSFVTVLFIRSGWQVRRREGVFFLISYASIIIWTLLRLR